MPIAGADGVSFTIVSGVAGNTPWYRSTVTIHVDASTGGPCADKMFTFSQSSDSVQCSVVGGTYVFQFKIDPDAPTVTGATADRAPDVNGWYTHPLTVAFAGSDSNSGLASCTTVSYSGPDGGSASASGKCTDIAGNVSAASSFPLKYDATPPAVSATPARAPDANGWYNHPVAVAFAGTDATSGIGACTPAVSYAGPDNAAASVSGSCVDAAGNSASAAFALKYDATPPRLDDVAVAVDDGTSVTLSWHQPQDTAMVAITRAPESAKSAAKPVFKGLASRFRDAGLKPGVTYRYTLTALDQAGNTASAEVKATVRALYAPVQGSFAKAGDRLAWVPSKGANYYNVQLFRNGRKVFSAWPLTASFRLPGSWTFNGRKVTLSRGTYRWYVWPGHGARAKAKYGPLIGGSLFRVR